MTLFHKNAGSFPFDRTSFHNESNKTFLNSIKHFKKITSFFAFFKISFILFLILELFSFFFLVLLLPKSSLIAINLAAIFLTFFSYLILLFYFKAKKPEQFADLQKRFIDSCRQALSIPKGSAEHHLTIARASTELASYLHDFEYRYYLPPKHLAFLASNAKKIGCFLHKKDVFKMKEMLFQSAIKEHLDQIRATPTDLEVHTSLANTYVALSKLYLQAQRSFSKKRHNGKEVMFEQKFHNTAQMAIEEFTILSDYVPNAPWARIQLALCYHNLLMPEKEAEEYENILKLTPNDAEILFQLGVIYFKLKLYSKGLRIYEQLKRSSYQKANELISFYTAKRETDLLEES